ncbi:MAG: hypothetical protein ABI432_15030 [Flavobacteriales bacterium]
MKRSSLLLAAVILICSCAMAQHLTSATPKKDTRPLMDRLWFGGGVGLSFGTVTSISVEPMVGYFVDQKNKLSVGTGVTYWYYSDNRYTPAYTNDAFGYRLFTRYRPIPQLFGHVEFLHLNTDVYSVFDNEVQRAWVPHMLVGGGYVQSMGGRASIYFQVLWEVLQDPNSVYRNQGPIISGGVGIGF